ncbi:MAG: hypothetical protein ABIR54_01645 [Burkholderiaceae bacterium]|jgi:hypothetical protein
MTHSTCPPPEGGSRIVRTATLAGIATLASLFLAACGGDGDSPTPTPAPPPAVVTQVPASAAVNDMTLEAFAFGLAQSDTTEPLTLDLVPTLPSSETEDPIITP